MRFALILTLSLLAAPAMAQQAEEDARAGAAILPMLQEISPQAGGLLAGCVVAYAQPAEKATMAAAPGPSAELGALVTQILARPETIACVQASIPG